MTSVNTVKLDTQKIPPHSLEAEQAVLGGMLMDKEALLRVVDAVTPESFYREANQAVFNAIKALFDRGEPVDLVTVTEQLRKDSSLERVGGAAYLTELLESVHTTANVEHYAKIVEEKFFLRRLISTGSEIVSLAFEAGEDEEDVIDEAQKLMMDVIGEKLRRNFVEIKDVLKQTLEDLDKNYNKSGLTGVPTGYVDLDYYTTGFQKSDLIIVAARPSIGKTALCLNMAAKMAADHKVPIAFFSLEMPAEQLAKRLLCSEGEVDGHRLRTGTLREDEWKRLNKTFGRLSEAPLFIDDTSGISVIEIRAKARRLKIEQPNLGLIIVDYLQLIRGRGRIENRNQEVSDIVRSLKTLARELNIPVIVISQLSRFIEQRQEKTPRLSDLRESGEIEQTADLVLFISRDEEESFEGQEAGTVARIHIAKHRNGPTGEIELVFRKEYAKFSNKEPGY